MRITPRPLFRILLQVLVADIMTTHNSHPSNHDHALPIDSGFYSEAAVAGIEARGADGFPQTQIIAAVVRTGHHRSVADLASKVDPPPPGPGTTARKDMIHRSATKAGKAL
jgi:hypothetical protein